MTTIEKLLEAHEGMKEQVAKLSGSEDPADRERAQAIAADLKASERHHFGMASGDAVTPQALVKIYLLCVKELMGEKDA